MSSLTNYSLFVPRVFDTIEKDLIITVFSKFGKVKDVDLVFKQDDRGQTYNQVYVHFVNWYNNKESRRLHDEIQTGDVSRVYNDSYGHYWNVLLNKATKRDAPTARKAKIDLDYFSNKQQPKPSQPLNNTSYALDFTEYPPLTKTESKIAPTLPDTEANPKTEPKIAPTLSDTEQEQFVNAQIEKEIEYEEDLQEFQDFHEFQDLEDSYLEFFDSRYVRTLEEENKILRKKLYAYAIQEEINRLHKEQMDLENYY